MKAAGTQPGARDRAPSEPSHTPQGPKAEPLHHVVPPQALATMILPRSPLVPQTQRLRPPTPGIQECVPRPLHSLCPSLLHILVSSRTLPAVPSGPCLELNKCAFSFFPWALSVCCCLWEPEDWWKAEVTVRFPPSPQGLPFLPHPSFHTSPRGLPFSAPWSSSVSLRPSGGGHCPSPPPPLRCPPPLQFPPLLVGLGNPRGND